MYKLIAAVPPRPKNAFAAAVLAAVLASLPSATASAVPVGDSGPFSGPAGDQDASAFWVDVENELPGWSAGKDQQLAQLMCQKLDSGYSEGDLIAEIANGDGSSVGAIRYVVHAAEWHFCPQYY
ncbi:DUF732 domain-containing protein [Mycobacterium alsense]|uniref:DUF732 domain-containing protein n=1 Tax=Mycobacterium alsense TaxID=324058 RepID=UPI000B073D57|nr:DUF732 domain-containing protein [Mycobacterium alsense]